MESYKKLYPQICAFENLHLAFCKARRGKRKFEHVADFEYRLEENLIRLQEELQSETYRPGPYRNFYIHEPKRRKISAAPFRDRVVHHALCNVIEPIFDSRFIYDSYACRKGKGTHRAIERCSHWVEHRRYFLKCDIKQFFPSVDHEVLYGLIARRIADPRVMRLVRLILKSGEGILASEYMMEWFPGDDLLTPLRPRGLPIGNLTSQFWGNVYLDGLDHFVKEDLRERYYLRYVDDFLVFGEDKDRLHEVKKEIEAFLGARRMKFHPAKCYVAPCSQGADFLGFRILPGHRRLRRENVKRFKRRLKKFQFLYRTGGMPISKITESVRSWCAHAEHGDTYRLREAILSRATFTRARDERIPALC